MPADLAAEMWEDMIEAEAEVSIDADAIHERIMAHVGRIEAGEAPR